MEEPSRTDLLEALLARVRAQQDGGDARGARALLDGADAALKRFGTWHYAHGSLSMALGEPDVALADFEAAVELEPEVAEFRANLGAVLLERAKAGDKTALARATRELEAAAKLGPVLPNTFNNLGTAQLFAGKHEAALVSFDQALKLDPRHVPALYNRAAALHALGKEAASLKALEATLAVDPGFAPALESRANAMQRMGRK